MAGFVLDASVAASWCFADERTAYTDAVLLATANDRQAQAPRLWAYEIRNTVLMGHRRQRISAEDARRFLASLPRLGITLTDPPSHDRLYELALAYGLTVYDAAYLELAQRLSLPLATLDKRLTAAAAQVSVPLFEPDPDAA